MKGPLRFYGLLYISHRGERFVNLKQADPLTTYLKNAHLCSQSIASFGGQYELITNAPEDIDRRMRQLSIDDLSVRGFPFRWSVPPGIQFHSAHFKLELIEAFGTGGFGEYVALLDLDTVMCAPLRVPQGLSVYDISDQIFPAYGAAVVRRDLENVAGRTLTSHRWFGGEFIAGTPGDFNRLSIELKECWRRYAVDPGAFHHTGDEMVLSAALNRLTESRSALTDVGRPGGVARWWSGRTLSPLPALRTVMDRSILHLPGDKRFLARESQTEFIPASFLCRYRRHVRRRLPANVVKAGIDRARGGPVKSLPRLGSRSSVEGSWI